MRIFILRSKWICLILVAVLTGCKSYRPAPLIPQEVVTRVYQTRLQPDSPTVEATGQKKEEPEANGKESRQFTLEQAGDWLRKHGPDVQETLAEYRTALAVAKIKTPFPNPGLEIGPQFGFGPDLGPVNRLGPFGAIGFSIPLGKRLRRRDELNRAVAEVARINALSSFRELYLELREKYSALIVSDRRIRARKSIGEAAKKSLDAGKRLVAAGQASALDMAMFELEYQRSQVEIMGAERDATGITASLSRLIGVHAEQFKRVSDNLLPELPSESPSLEKLKEKLVKHHPGLGRIRAAYHAAERSLRFEISKQFPDLQLGPSFDNEIGEKKTVVGLSLGIEIPFFDRNQQGIAEAEKVREGLRTKFEAEANRALATLERAYVDLQLAMKTRRFMNERILPKAQKNVDLARRALEAGAADALRLLDAERSVRQIQIDALEAELAERSAWIDLERAVGYPLINFPSEQADSHVEPPLELKERGKEISVSPSSAK